MIRPTARPTWLTLTMAALAVLLVATSPPSDGRRRRATTRRASLKGTQGEVLKVAPNAPRNVKKTRKKTRRKAKRKKPLHREGLYIVLGLGAASIDDNIPRYNFNTAFKGQIGLGYRFNKSLALEGNGLLLASSLEDTRDSSQNEGTSLAGGHLSLKYYIPLAPPRVESYLQGGLGYVGSPEFPDGQDPIGATIVDLGVGVEVRTADWFAIGLRGGYMTAVQEQNDVDISAFSWMLTLQFELDPTTRRKKRKKKKKTKKRPPRPRY